MPGPNKFSQTLSGRSKPLSPEAREVWKEKQKARRIYEEQAEVRAATFRDHTYWQRKNKSKSDDPEYRNRWKGTSRAKRVAERELESV